MSTSTDQNAPLPPPPPNLDAKPKRPRTPRTAKTTAKRRREARKARPPAYVVANPERFAGLEIDFNEALCAILCLPCMLDKDDGTLDFPCSTTKEAVYFRVHPRSHAILREGFNSFIDRQWTYALVQGLYELTEKELTALKGRIAPPLATIPTSQQRADRLAHSSCVAEAVIAAALGLSEPVL